MAMGHINLPIPERSIGCKVSNYRIPRVQLCDFSCLAILCLC